MPSGTGDESSSSSGQGAIQGEIFDSRGGVRTLIDGARPSVGEGDQSESAFAESASRRKLSTRIPSWVFYLADIALMSAVIWMLVLNPEPFSRRDGLFCLLLVTAAAVLGTWPWLRNVLYCDSLGESQRLPTWILTENVIVGNEPKTLVIHTRQPFVAVEVSKTSWNALNTKPFWIDGPPNLPPGGVKGLLDEAGRFYLSQLRRRERERSHASTDQAPSSTSTASDSAASRPGSV